MGLLTSVFPQGLFLKDFAGRLIGQSNKNGCNLQETALMLMENLMRWADNGTLWTAGKMSRTALPWSAFILTDQGKNHHGGLPRFAQDEGATIWVSQNYRSSQTQTEVHYYYCYYSYSYSSYYFLLFFDY